jgi:ADP-ribose pyrophosphatase YjhB (NUDIX family)
MSIEPEKFFVGLMDFFAILLPGALATFLIMDDVGQMVIGDRFNSLKGPEGWAAFFIASYLSGHVIFLLGSWLDEFYDRLRRQSLNRQIARLARRGRLLPWPARALVWIIFKRERDVAVDRASRLKRHSLGSIDAASAVNTFQWSKALLTLESPASLAVVQRFEADSKFFRSFAVLLLALAVTWPLHRRWPPDQSWPAWGIVVVIALLLLALLRYMEQRYKATNQAYWSVITLIARTGTVTIEKAPAADGAPTHAGGVVFRRRGGVLEFLLVEATNEPSVWVLPKGHIEPPEDERETAVREVHEEAGVWARILDALGPVSYTVDGRIITVQFFLMESMARGWRSDRDRRHIWLPENEACETASHSQTRELLLSAKQWLTQPRST